MSNSILNKRLVIFSAFLQGGNNNDSSVIHFWSALHTDTEGSMQGKMGT